ncbi:GNAT family N-acetyltransferase [Zobellia galactanivorans]|uniref:GCN5-related N-acetyltransferase n=1 Tax=Zobellia galactanivorans (strain DSM 12802 / CCUG 47099 / CIP 106680 / NCIMB 13871 / Dsij) TaxID=63186 RepID=G0LCU7_ZOBGA|nr:GNAT family N-acetyltransferase [Zobellia galactanivorans]MBU3027107.1 GNAT family N-acetyltransferase [Zobellia galactanivorans]MDO6807963.1 GNAT family N-acetyltransferase [Zobellia galactanivorans]CAZ94079.1 GCN5-related N-acetyltransferase [Zobellia galactanivorans]
MLSLVGEHVSLRALEPEDLDFLYELENNPEIWEISGTVTPYSKHVLKLYLDNAYRDIYDVKQLRLCICNQDDLAIGFIDLFDFDPKNGRAGVGIVVLDKGDRNKGIGSEALQLLCDYAFGTLALHQLYANVMEGNDASIHLFKKMGFKEVGLKKDWIFSEGGYKNEILFQKINA